MVFLSAFLRQDWARCQHSSVEGGGETPRAGRGRLAASSCRALGRRAHLRTTGDGRLQAWDQNLWSPATRQFQPRLVTPSLSPPRVDSAKPSCLHRCTSPLHIPASLHPARCLLLASWLWTRSGPGRPTSFLAVQSSAAAPPPTRPEAEPWGGSLQVCFLGHPLRSSPSDLTHLLPSSPHTGVVLSLLNNSVYEGFSLVYNGTCLSLAWTQRDTDNIKNVFRENDFYLNLKWVLFFWCSHARTCSRCFHLWTHLIL